MIATQAMTLAARNDAELVAESLSGNREAFGEIVSRYQSLICSLAYSATGSLSHSEDLAQETFVAAWRQMRDLREPDRLRSWLCGIARNRVNNWLRRQGREPSHAAETLEAIHKSPAGEPLPNDQAISNEEQAILWRSLGRVPEIYREPLVLFYRERQSIAAVARNLELSEDTVKQRLSRGRRLLHEEVLAFVEGALERTNPGKAFAIGVLAALPVFTTAASAATAGAIAVKGSTTAKAAGMMGIASAILTPILIVFGTWVGYRADLDDARSNGERGFVRSFYRRLAGCVLGFTTVFMLLIFLLQPMLKTNPSVFVSLMAGLAFAYLVALAAFGIWTWRERRRLTAELDAAPTVLDPAKAAWEYQSPLRVLGLPVVHVRIGGGLRAQRKPVKAWIAVGDCAVGLLFAFGGLAVAPVSIGGCAIGLLSFGGSAVGWMALGGFSLGWWALGGVAVGWQACGGCAIAWNAAYGGAAVAFDFALGGMAQAEEANNRAAHLFMQSQPFFRATYASMRYIVWLHLIWVIPMLYWWRAVIRARSGTAGTPS